MRIVLLGATGGIGSSVLRAALADGHDVVALTRDAAKLSAIDDPHLTVIEGDIGDPAVAARVVDGAEAVISALGAGSNTSDEVRIAESTTRNIVGAMATHGPRRLVALSGAGVTLPGEKKALSGRLAAWIVDRAAHWVVEAKRREAAIIMAADLDWTLVRPPNVVAGPPGGAVRLRDSLPGGSFRVTQGDVAAALLRCATTGASIREAPFLG